MYSQNFPIIPILPVAEKDKPAEELTAREKERLGSLESERRGVEETFDEESATFMDDK